MLPYRGTRRLPEYGAGAHCADADPAAVRLDALAVFALLLLLGLMAVLVL